MNWHSRFKRLRNYFGWTLKDVSEITGNTYSGTRTSIKPSSPLPRNLKLAVVVFEKLTKIKKNEN